MLLDPTTKVTIRKRKTNNGVEIKLVFYRRVWWFIWEPISYRRYWIDVHEFWDPFGWHQPGGLMAGEPLRHSTVLAEYCETWMPNSFDLKKRIQDIYAEIVSDRKQSESIFKKLAHDSR